MSTNLYISAPVSVREELAAVPAGTDAAIKAASDAYHANPMGSGGRDEHIDTFAAYETAISKLDPHGLYDLIGDYGYGLRGLQATSEFLARFGLDHSVDSTEDPALVREILTLQRRRARQRNVIGLTPLEVDDENRAFNATIDRLIAALDRGMRFGLCWS